MSISAFEKLNAEEKESILRVPVLVSAMIAGADMDVDQRETELAQKVMHYRQFSSDPTLHGYYEAAAESFEESLEALIASFGGNAQKMVEDLKVEIAKINPVLSKVEADYANQLVSSWRSLAKRVAEATGGLLGFMSIDAAEKELISLPMIDL